MSGYRSGFVALVGRPNVGKSTLLNRLVGQKVSIVTPRPQTTRHRVLGIRSDERGQIVFIDTPGLHAGGRQALNRYMNRAAAGAIGDADIAVVVVEALKLTDADDEVVTRAAAAGVPLGAVVNKVDRVPDKSALLPFIADLQERAPFAFVVPLSAESGEHCGSLVDELLARLPEGEPLYPVDQVTDRSMRFVAAERIREKLILRLRQEVPYGVAVEVENYIERPARTEIDATIWVARDSHKGIVIGKGGTMLRDVGTAARRDLEAELARPVVLRLHVKVREGWVDDDNALHRFGYE